MIEYGSLVISLDFEMMWGCHDWATTEGYGNSNIRNVRTVIDRILELFDKYGIHASFATVGLLFYSDKKDALSCLPKVKPSYIDANKSPYKDHYLSNIDEKDAELYFAKDIIYILKQHTNIEIGSHTFSHYYCWETGQTVDEFEADVEKMKEVSSNEDIDIQSIVFPKNQVSEKYLKLCAKYGIKNYRGNAAKFFSKPKNRWEALKNRICRLLDAYINIGGFTSVPYKEIDVQGNLVNIKASRFLRPYNPKLAFIEKLRLRRIKREIFYAAQNNEMYHLWWHPHNFGDNMNENLCFLENILKYYSKCHEKYGMQSYTMGEMAKYIEQ